eukprot:145811_1
MTSIRSSDIRSVDIHISIGVLVGACLHDIYPKLSILILCYFFHKKYTLSPQDAKQARCGLLLSMLTIPLLHLKQDINLSIAQYLHSIGASNIVIACVIWLSCIIGCMLYFAMVIYYMLHEDDVIEPVAYNY